MNKKFVYLLSTILVLTFLFWNSSNRNQATTLPSSNTPTIASSSGVLGATSLKCVSKDGLPDPTCTPGVVAETDAYTVCHRSTKDIRPPVSYTNDLKVEQINEYGYSDTNLSDYEEDHLISLELGGSPTDPKNLWPEPGASPNLKDKIENLCHQKVCDGSMSLSDAQEQIATNWKTACQ